MRRLWEKLDRADLILQAVVVLIVLLVLLIGSAHSLLRRLL